MFFSEWKNWCVLQSTVLEFPRIKELRFFRSLCPKTKLNSKTATATECQIRRKRDNNLVVRLKLLQCPRVLCKEKAGCVQLIDLYCHLLFPLQTFLAILTKLKKHVRGEPGWVRDSLAKPYRNTHRNTRPTPSLRTPIKTTSSRLVPSWSHLRVNFDDLASMTSSSPLRRQ